MTDVAVRGEADWPELITRAGLHCTGSRSFLSASAGADPITISRTTPADAVMANTRVGYTAEGVTDGGEVEWMVRQHGENPFVPIGGAASASLELSADPALNGAELVARTVDASGTVAQESTTPTILWMEDAAGAEATAGAGSIPWIAGAGVAAAAVVALLAVVRIRRRSGRNGESGRNRESGP